MCIVAIGLERSARYPFILAANRDEAHARAAAPAHWWADPPGVLAGKDLAAGGTWLGITRQGRVAAVTNVFEPERSRGPRSRGDLVLNFLASGVVPALDERSQFGPFRLFTFDWTVAANTASLVSNRESDAAAGPGLHVISNNPTNEAWPKTAQVAEAFDRLVDSPDPLPDLFALLKEQGSDHPSSIFVLGPNFGTRCSSVVLIDGDGIVRFEERRFDPEAYETGRSTYQFELSC
jgi:uncharacterized protein with NRDE domain